MAVTVSVIIPAFNAAKLITRSLDSIAHQTVLPFEVIVVDDGSSDDTYQAALSHSLSELTTVRVFKKANGGQASARNFGIRVATSQYIALLDQDDEFSPLHIENLSNAAGIYPDATLFFAAVERVFDSDEVAQSEKHLPDFRAIAQSHCDFSSSLFKVMKQTLFNDLIKGNFINPSSSMFPRIYAGETIIFDDSLRYLEDRELFIRLAVAGKCIFIDEVGCSIHRTGNNFSNSKKGIIHAPYFVKVLENVINRNLFSEDSSEYNLVLNELSARVDDLLYFASHTGLKATFSAIKIHLRWKKNVLPWLYTKRLCYAALVSIGLLTN